VPLQQAAETPASYLIQPLNRVKIVNQLTITGKENQPRIPDAILYINGLPLVVFEFKSAVREQEANIGDAYKQLCTAIAAIFRSCLSITRCALSATASITAWATCLRRTSISTPGAKSPAMKTASRTASLPCTR
jgi:hypothetical protein